MNILNLYFWYNLQLATSATITLSPLSLSCTGFLTSIFSFLSTAWLCCFYSIMSFLSTIILTTYHPLSLLIHYPALPSRSSLPILEGGNEWTWMNRGNARKNRLSLEMLRARQPLWYWWMNKNKRQHEVRGGLLFIFTGVKTTFQVLIHLLHSVKRLVSNK